MFIIICGNECTKFMDNQSKYCARMTGVCYVEVNFNNDRQSIKKNLIQISKAAVIPAT